MQIVIELDEKTYNDIKEGKIYSSLRDVPLESVNAIRRGTVLPKGHGQLVDMDAVLRYIKEPLTKAEFMIRMSAEKVLEADKEVEE